MRIALVGNPNSGKTTLFNQITGLHRHVANWPGSTVEFASGAASHDGDALTLADLPGVYGLSAYADDERVTRDYLLHEAPDVALLVLDAASLERSLFLALETLELYPTAAIALNRIDIAYRRGTVVDAEALGRRLGVPVVEVIANRGEGVQELLDTVVAVGRGQLDVAPAIAPYDDELEAAVLTVAAHVETGPSLGAPSRWIALRLLQGDVEALDRVRAHTGAGVLDGLISCCEEDGLSFEVEHADLNAARVYLNGLAPRQAEFALSVADAKYAWIHTLVQECTNEEPRRQADWTERIDRLALHPLSGPMLAALVFGLMFWLSFQASTPLSDAIAAGIDGLSAMMAEELASVNAPGWLQSLLADGVLAGVGAVLAFVPYMVMFFASIALLEASGYMARAALLGDRVMQAVGLHGRGLFSLVSAFGCNVPALAATRGLESRRDRLITGLVIPFVPCNARLGVMAIVTGALFGSAGGQVLFALVVMSLLVVAVTALALRRAMPSEPAPLLLDLPPYALPRWQDVAVPALHHCLLFVRRIWRFLVPATIVIWALTFFPIGAEPEKSYAGVLGGWLAVLGQPLGFDWRLMVAILFGFVAKETTLGTLGVLYGMSDPAPLSEALAGSLTPLVGFAFLVVYMLYVPCLATMVQLRKELGGWRWAGLGILLNVSVAVALGLAVARLGQLLGLGSKLEGQAGHVEAAPGGPALGERRGELHGDRAREGAWCQAGRDPAGAAAARAVRPGRPPDDLRGGGIASMRRLPDSRRLLRARRGVGATHDGRLRRGHQPRQTVRRAVEMSTAPVDRTLADLKADEELVISQIGGPEPFRRRLYGRGFLPGATVRVIRRLPFGGPLEVETRGVRIGLRVQDARCVSGTSSKIP
ncbi:MAG: ferrous iron transport protein B [Chloroflexi bacterium]|nr:ferrous iron transport protein B [Chloroflexota bacterium]